MTEKGKVGRKEKGREGGKTCDGGKKEERKGVCDREGWGRSDGEKVGRGEGEGKGRKRKTEKQTGEYTNTKARR